MYLNTNIRSLRKRMGWNQHQLADQIDKTCITIGNYERGKIVPSLTVVLDMCDRFGVDLDTIVYYDVARNGFPSSVTPEEEMQKLREQLLTQQHINALQEKRVAELEREIEEYAPELAERLELVQRMAMAY